MAFIEEHAWALRAVPEKGRKPNKASAAVITITGSSLNFTPVQELVEHADMKKRTGTHVWWEGYKDLAETMGSKKYFAAQLAQTGEN